MKKKSQKPIIYAFIDSQNLNLGTSKDIVKHKKRIYSGWRLDFKKFRLYLQYSLHVSKAFLFIGYIPANKMLYKRLTSFGYTLIYKQTIYDSHGNTKGNVDAELVLNTMIEFENFDEAVIVSGDGDFFCLHEYLDKQGKLRNIIIPNKYSESKLLAPFQKYKKFLYREKDRLERKP